MDDQDLARIGRALSHPLRIRYLRTTSVRGCLSPSEYARDFGTPLGNIAYHAKALLEIDVLRIEELVPRRGAMEHRYALTEENGATAIATIEFLDRVERNEAALDQLGREHRLDEPPTHAEDPRERTPNKRHDLGGRRQSSSDELLDAIGSNPGATTGGLAEQLGLRPTQVSLMIARARNSNLIQKRGDGWGLRTADARRQEQDRPID